MTFIDTAVAQRLSINGASLHWWEWGTPVPGRASLLFVHASGFHARTWDQIIRHFDGFHCLAVDLRGHGGSEATPIRHWRQFSDDLIEWIQRRDLRELVGIGHSLGGHVVTVAAARLPERFRRLILIDPAIISKEAYRAESSSAGYSRPEDHPAARRRSRFESPDAMLERFRDRSPYSLFTPAALRDYCVHGLRPDGDGFELACSPVTEASVYMGSHSFPEVHECIEGLQLPVLVIRAQDPTPDNPIQHYSASPTWPELAGAFPKGRYLHYPQYTHFLPMQVPDEMARVIAAELA